MQRLLHARDCRPAGTPAFVGELFDHGLDSMACWLMPWTAIMAAGLQDSHSITQREWYWLSWSFLIGFYVPHLEKYMTGACVAASKVPPPPAATVAAVTSSRRLLRSHSKPPCLPGLPLTDTRGCTRRDTIPALGLRRVDDCVGAVLFRPRRLGAAPGSATPCFSRWRPGIPIRHRRRDGSAYRCRRRLVYQVGFPVEGSFVANDRPLVTALLRSVYPAPPHARYVPPHTW